MKVSFKSLEHSCSYTVSILHYKSLPFNFSIIINNNIVSADQLTVILTYYVVRNIFHSLLLISN